MKPNTTKQTFTNPASGSALQIHVTVGDRGNRIRKIDKNGLLFVELENQRNANNDLNHTLCCFLGEVFGLPLDRIEIAAGHQQDDKLVCLFDIAAEAVNQRIAIVTTE